MLKKRTSPATSTSELTASFPAIRRADSMAFLL